ncbi:MAG: hypothetical protein K0R18_2022 [Bacillales bacterium]|nr:hypothetical protein [Bacillales bacterium]
MEKKQLFKLQGKSEDSILLEEDYLDKNSKLFQLSEKISDLYNKLVNQNNNEESKKIVEIKEKYFTSSEFPVKGLGIQASILKLGEEKAQKMFDELKVLEQGETL